MLSMLAGAAMGQSVGNKLPPNVFAVKPIPHAAANAAAIGDLPIVRGNYFSYALPHGWRVGEEGQFALSLVAPDSRAFTVMVGNAGMFPNYPLDRYVWDKMMALHPQNLQLGAPVQVAPAAGFQFAYQFPVTFVGRGGFASRGMAKCNVAPAYDTQLIVMTGAFSVDTQWAGYSSWLPRLAEQISAIDGAAFGARGIMAQNLRLSKEYGETTRAYREWSQQNWQQVTDQRNAAEDRRNYDVRENLGPTRAYANPYDSGSAVDLPLTYKHYWVNRQGAYVGTNDPSVNPNEGSTGEWKQMPPARP
jgi:hypothetical protein